MGGMQRPLAKGKLLITGLVQKDPRNATCRQQKPQQLPRHTWTTGTNDIWTSKKPDFTAPKWRSDNFPHLLLYRTGYIVYHYKLPGFFKQRDCIFLNKEVPRCGSQILPLLSTTADSLYHCCMSGYMATKTAKNQNQSNSTLNNQHAPYHLTPKAREYFGHCCIPNLSFQFLLEVCMFHLSVFSLEEGSAAFAPFPALSWCQCPLLALGYPGSTSPTISLEGHISKVPSSCTKCSSDHLKGRNTTRGFLLKIQTCSSCP